MAVVCRYPGKICPNDRQGSCITSAQKYQGFHWKQDKNSVGSLSAKVLYCMDCVFWCGRCAEPTMQGKRSINRIALSEACEKFKT